MIRLYIQAPFAAFRTFTAGWYRPTAAFLTPSAAYGLALNLAGIETRRDDGLSAMTVTQFGLPPARIALGAAPENPQGRFPSVQTLFQQLHNYPVGSSGKERKDDAKGNKYNITPVRREFLANLRAYVCLDFFENPEVESAIRHALDERSPTYGPRYGLPFLGDNAFMLDKVNIHHEPVKAHWYRPLGKDTEAGIVPHTTRLTTWIDRQDMSKTKSALYAPDENASEDDLSPKWTAWTEIQPPPAPKLPEKPPRRKGKS